LIVGWAGYNRNRMNNITTQLITEAALWFTGYKATFSGAGERLSLFNDLLLESKLCMY